MAIETKRTCPLGHECEKVVDGAIQECMWYVQIAGADPQTGERIDTKNCAIAWQPILMIDGNNTNRSVAASVQSLRNETVTRQDLALDLVNRDEKLISSS